MPTINRRRSTIGSRAIPVPTRDAVGVTILAVFLLVVALNLQAGWVYAIDALLISLLLIGWLSAFYAVRGLTVARTMPREAVDGDHLLVTLSVVPSRWPRYFVELHDAVPGLTPHRTLIPWLSPRRPGAVTYRAQALRRGVHCADAVEIRSRGLTELFAARARANAGGTIVIYPRYWPLVRFTLPGRSEASAELLARPARRGLEFAGVRHFRDGDDLRHVHWRSTARRGTLVVREFEQQTHSSVTLLLDTRPQVQAGAGADSTFEDLVRAAASIAQFVTRAGPPVHLVTSSGTRPDHVVARWREALDTLARVNPDGVLSPVEVYTAILPAGTPVVVLTPDRDAVEALIRRGIPLVAVIADAASYENPRIGNREQGAGMGDQGTGNRERGTGKIPGVPTYLLRQGEEVGACLDACLA